MAAEYDRPQLYHEAIVLPGPDSAQAIIAFRIPHALLVFRQEGSGFVANVDLTVELYRDQQKVAERVWRGEKRVHSFEQTTSESVDLTGHVRFPAVPGAHTYRFSFSGSKVDRLWPGSQWPFEVPDFASGGSGRPFFANRLDSEGGRVRIEPTVLGGEAPFATSVTVVVPFGKAVSDDALEFRLYRLAEESSSRRSGGRGRATQRRQPVRGESEIDLAPGPDDQLILKAEMASMRTMPLGRVDADCLCWSPVEGIGRIALFEMDTDTLDHAQYLIEIIGREESARAFHSRFGLHWRGMPLSLHNVDIAIRNLSFIESREKIREMLRGSREDQIAAFRAYWAERDPTPETLRNELMEEYYARIDRAASEFRTGRSPLPDGLRTDAARIYIIHGPPDDVSSTFPSTGGVQQIWTYSDGRRFVFWAASSMEPLVLEETSRAEAGR